MATAAAVLGEWLDRAEKRRDSILNVYSRGPASDSGGQARLLGLGLAPQTRSGRVPVAKVYEDGACYGLIESGDDIVAINGTVLRLDDSTADLRRGVEELADGQTLTLRVEREDTLIDVETVIDRPRNPKEEMVADAVRALRRLQTVSRHLAFATLAVTQSQPDSFHAHLRLRFSANR